MDWSGSASAAVQRTSIVAADWQAGSIQITSGRSRSETIDWLIDQARETPDLVVGLDFAFSFPAWFVRQHVVSHPFSIESFWQVAAERGEDWLSRCSSPFWGKRLASGGGEPRPQDHRGPSWLGYRQADRRNAAGIQPKSPFQIGGAGAVGTGSIRGIPGLLTLREAGFSVWPFHAPLRPVVMEIYPRSFTGPVNKSSREAREAYLQRLDTTLGPEILRSAAMTEDAFDALCSVIGMVRQAEEIAQLLQSSDEITLTEGSIFPGRPILTG